MKKFKKRSSTNTKSTKGVATKKVCTDCGCEKHEEGTELEIGPYELQYYRDHLPPHLQAQFDQIEKQHGSKAAAFAYTLQQVLADLEDESLRGMRIDLPDLNTTIMPKRSSGKPARAISTRH